MSGNVLVDHRCFFIFATEKVYMLEIVENLSVIDALSLVHMQCLVFLRV